MFCRKCGEKVTRFEFSISLPNHYAFNVSCPCRTLSYAGDDYEEGRELLFTYYKPEVNEDKLHLEHGYCAFKHYSTIVKGELCQKE